MTDTNDIIDAREREEALDPSRSFIVEAPAGSGKTGLLMQRFLVLLSTVGRPEELLALTFTKKAAGEMERRIMDALYAASNGQRAKNGFEKGTLELAARALERDRELNWRLLENPGRLKVRTIDSFCATLARQMPLLSGGRLDVTEDASRYYNEAARRTVEMVEDEGVCGEAVRTALRHLDNSAGGLMKRIVAMLEKRDQWLRHVKSGDSPEELKDRLEGSFRRLVEAALAGAVAAFPKRLVPRLLPAARFAAGNLKEAGSDSKAALLTGLKALPGAGAEDLGAWQGIAELLTTKDGWRKPKGINAKQGLPANGGFDAEAIRSDFQRLLEDLSCEDALLDALLEAKAAPYPAFDPYDWEALLAFLRLLPVAGAHLTDVFAESGKVDFQSVAASALKALGPEDAPTDLMLALDLKIRHILVDEYQDTSRAQLELLRSLTRGWTEGDGRTLFVVGDPMQSIYMFREAEVGLFLDARINGIGGVALKSLKLKSNFRSSVEVVSWVNRAFAGAFPEREDIFTGAVVYADSTAASRERQGRAVGITLFDWRDDGREAARVLEIIKDIRGRGPSESIALLCRSRGHLAEIVALLKSAALRFRARELDQLSERSVVRDLLMLLRAALHPFDRVAWLAALRAPWCGASLIDLHALCAGDAFTPVPELSDDMARMSMLTEDGAARVRPVIGGIKKAASCLGRVEIRPLIEGLWTGLGGPACVDAAGLRDAGAFFDVLETLPPGFTLKEVEERAEKLYALHGGADPAAIDLMTIHRAKGLEFDNVIIPGLGKHPRSEDKKLMLWLERKAAGADDLLLAPIEKKRGGESPLYAYLTRINRKKSSLELARLFYVAATRARKGLYLFGHAGPGGPGERTLLSVIRDSLDMDRIEQVNASEKERKTRGVRIKRLPDGWAMPTPAPAIAVQVAKEAPAVTGPEFHWAGEKVKHLGTVVHRYLCRVAGEGLDKWDQRRLDNEKERAAGMLRSLGLGATEADEYAERAVGMLKAALNDKAGRWVLGPHPEAKAEEPVTGVVGGEVAHAVIDRTFVDENGVRWVIDYKTGSHEGGSREEFLESEKERYRTQLERYAAIFREAEKDRVIKKGLYFPALSEFVEIP